MKKWFSLLLSVVMVFMFTAACAESSELFSQIQGQFFSFCSGAGAWETQLIVGEDGAFIGNFHDSEMGDSAEAYPYGTVYGCSFHGSFSDPQPLDEYSWTVKVEVEMDEGQAGEEIEDGTRYVTAEPYGFGNAKAVTFYVPGTPVDQLPEDFMIWSHLQEIDPDAKEIPYYAIWNEADDAGFISEITTEDEILMGGWTTASDTAITEEIRALFEKGMEGLVGVNYEPIAYLGSQVVAGINHAILCQATVVYPGAESKLVVVYLYEDLQGNVSILNIADFQCGMSLAAGLASQGD